MNPIAEKKTIRSFCFVSIVLMLGLLAGACASTPKPDPVLIDAQNEYQKAKTPMVEENAPVALRQAGKYLSQAEQATEDQAINHYAYLSKTQAAIAVALAEQEAAKKQVEDLKQKKQQLLLDIRERRTKQAYEQTGEAQVRIKELEKKLEQLEIEKQEQASMEAQARIQELEKELKEIEGKKTKRGFVFTMSDILFEFDKAQLKPGGMRVLAKVADIMKEFPNRNILIEGHTDSIGSEEYNMQLSKKRADTVASGLISRGVDSDRITAKGLGENYPIAPNDTASGRQQNRRVEIVLLEAGKQQGEN